MIMKKSIFIMGSFAIAALCHGETSPENQNLELPQKPTKNIFQNIESSPNPVKSIFKAMPPEEKERLTQLHRNNPNAFSQEIREKINRYKNKSGDKNTDEIQALVNKYRNAQNESDKKKLYAQIYKLTEKQFYEKLQENEKNLEAVEKKILELKEKCATRRKNAEKIISVRVGVLTDDPDLHW